MSRKIALGLFASAVVATSLVGPVAAESFTTRIEPRPFYGAVVTLEEGVRVIRPLPPERQVIINPNGTPLNLGFNETRVYEQRSVTNYNADGGRAGASGGDTVYGAPYLGYGRGFARERSYGGDHSGSHRGFDRGNGGVR